MNVATGLSTSHFPDPELGRRAVEQAMTKAGIDIASSVILFLTPEFARDPQPALLAAAKASRCTQIIGCTAAGLFTEEDWVLDSPAAAALVIGTSPQLLPSVDPAPDDLILALAAPNAINSSWITEPGIRFGGVSGDATGQGPFKVWCGGRINPTGRCEVVMRGVKSAIGASQGIRALTRPHRVTQVSGYDVLTLSEQPALNMLARELPLEVREMERIPLHLIMAGVVFGDPATAIAEGRYQLTPIIATNSDDRSVTLSARLAPGETMFWALRQPLAAERDMRMTLDRLEGQLGDAPDFGLLFTCMGRGPYFYGEADRDLDLVRQRYPDLPLIGFYGNGEIGPLNGVNQLFQYSAILGLFRHDV